MMSTSDDLKHIVFALPGKLSDKTGGTLYDRHLINALKDLGHWVDIIELAGAFPEPDARAVHDAVTQLSAVPRKSVLIVDGLALGALKAENLCRIKVPIVAMLHHPLGLEPGLSAKRAEALIENEGRSLSCARHVLVSSRHIAQTVRDLFKVRKEQVTVVRPGVALARSTQSSRTLARAYPPLILSVGLLHPRKGHDILLAALSKITDLEWQAKIVGRAHDADESIRLHQDASKLGLAHRVTLAGEIPETELLQDYERATLFALATRYEGYGLVFDEALQHGLPIVSCKVGAVTDTVPADAGRLVPPNDPDAFSKALRLLLTQSEEYERLSVAAASAGRTLPGWHDSARLVSNVLKRFDT